MFEVNDRVYQPRHGLGTIVRYCENNGWFYVDFDDGPKNYSFGVPQRVKGDLTFERLETVHVQATRIPSPLPEDSAERKKYPMYSGLLAYFPAALAAVSHHSYKGNEKHNPGLPMQHTRGLSADHEDALMRHLTEGDYEGVAWRALALLQEKLEAEGAPRAPAAR